MMNFCLSLLIALCLDRLFGWPEFIFRRFSHPVVGFGHLISLFESKLNKSTWSSDIRKATGVFSLFCLLTSFAALSFLILLVIPEGPIGVLVTSFLVWPLIAAKSLADHVSDVAEPLNANDLPEARQAVSMIVGRNSNQLGSNDIARAALESLAENTSDGVTAPLFWGVLLGFPGVLIYKFVNTADSMIGYKNEMFINLGWFGANCDKVLNYIPSRITGLIMVFAAMLLGNNWKQSYQILKRDSEKTSSPNAGYPMAALAGALDARFEKIEHYTIGDGIYDLSVKHVRSAIILMKVTTILFFGIVSIPIIAILSYLGLSILA